MTIFYFTATGNSLEVAKSLGGRCVSIPSVFDSDKLCFEDDAIGVVFPCHFSDIPMPVSLFLRKVTLNTPYLFGVVTLGKCVVMYAKFSMNTAKIAVMRSILLLLFAWWTTTFLCGM